MPSTGRNSTASFRPRPVPSFSGGCFVAWILSLTTIAVASDVVRLTGRGDPRSECYVSLEVTGRGTTTQTGPDSVVQNACGGKCAYKAQLCANKEAEATCSPAPLDFIDVTGRALLKRPRLDSLTGACGFPGVVVVRLHGKRFRRERLDVVAHTRKGTQPSRDRDRFTFGCKRTRGACCGDGKTQKGEDCDDGNLDEYDDCASDCTSGCGNGFQSTTEECDDGNQIDGDGCDSNCKLEQCNNGLKQAHEDCDPPGLSSPYCQPDEYCSSECKCVPRPQCACPAPVPDVGELQFTTGAGAEPSCGTLNLSDGTSLPRDCGALYVGGGDSILPALKIPDGLAMTANTSCIGRMLLVTSTSESSRCPEGRCFFGPPLPVIYGEKLGVCLVNRIASGLSGTIDCDSWRTELHLPIETTVYLTGDLINGSTQGPRFAGVQPCPLCIDGKCKGGVRHGMSCRENIAVPETARTSEDCLPPSETILSNTDERPLSIDLALTTGVATRSAERLGQQNVFFGLCRQDAREGPCFQGNQGCLALAASPLECEASATCSDPRFPSCQQHAGGAFGQTLATTITVMGMPGSNPAAGPTTVTLAGIFRVPPLFDPQDFVDGLAGLPGPGAIALPGTMQLLPVGPAARGSEP
jgi:cysteine-rich repeat protein